MTVVDASVVVDFLLGTGSEASDQLARLLRTDGVVTAPVLVDVEVAQAIRRFSRRGEIEEVLAGAMIHDLEVIPIRRYPVRTLVSRAYDFRHSLSVYDGVYLALAERLGVPLLTGDNAFTGLAGLAVDVRLVATSG